MILLDEANETCLTCEVGEAKAIETLQIPIFGPDCCGHFRFIGWHEEEPAAAA